jgi:hypothetical protein
MPATGWSEHSGEGWRNLWKSFLYSGNTPPFENRSKDSLTGAENHAAPLRSKSQSSDRGVQNKYPLDAGIMIGVGAAFDIHSGFAGDAPEWIKRSGLQWIYRLCHEPRRLWRRYLRIVPAYLLLSFLQVMGLKRFGE